LRPESGVCDGLTMFQCWARLDYEVGGNSPAFVQTSAGRRLLVTAVKDGHAYLVDADHFGTQYDRHRLVSACGAPGDPCTMDWAGMVVTQPAVSRNGESPLVIIPTFMPDATHAGGIVALSIVEREGAPRFERRWEYPRFDSADARRRFRLHPSRLALTDISGTEIGVIVETARAGQRGRLLAIRTDDGALVAETALLGPGYRFSLPLVHERTVHVASCASESGPGTLEAYTLDSL
jgi:hypothetical protein